MDEEIRLKDPQNPNTYFVQRVNFGRVETIKEVTVTTGEILEDPGQEIRKTVETITITRTTENTILDTI